MQIQYEPVISYLAPRAFNELIWVWPNWRCFGSEEPSDLDFGRKGMRRFGIVQSPVSREPILFYVDVESDGVSSGWTLWSRDRAADKFRAVAHCDCECPTHAIKDFDNWVHGIEDASVFGSWKVV